MQQLWLERSQWESERGPTERGPFATSTTPIPTQRLSRGGSTPASPSLSRKGDQKGNDRKEKDDKDTPLILSYLPIRHHLSSKTAFHYYLSRLIRRAFRTWAESPASVLRRVLTGLAYLQARHIITPGAGSSLTAALQRK